MDICNILGHGFSKCILASLHEVSCTQQTDMILLGFAAEDLNLLSPFLHVGGIVQNGQESCLPLFTELYFWRLLDCELESFLWVGAAPAVAARMPKEVPLCLAPLRSSTCSSPSGNTWTWSMESCTRQPHSPLLFRVSDTSKDPVK